MTTEALDMQRYAKAEPRVANKPPVADRREMVSRLIGGLFLLGFLSYGTGFALVSSVTATPEYVSSLTTHQTVLVVGALLMLLNTAVDVGKAVLFFPVLERHGKGVALTYFATMIVEVVLLSVGVLSLLALIPIGQYAAIAGNEGASLAHFLGSLALQANAMAYQVAELTLGGGCVFLCTLLYRTGLVPRVVAAAGLIGYPLLMAGTIAELFGLHIGVLLSLPGMIFELGLPVFLLSRGFRPAAYFAIAA